MAFTVTHVLVFYWSCFILEPRSLRPTFLETARADSLISMPPQMEDAIFGVNGDYYIREVSAAFVFLDFFCPLSTNSQINRGCARDVIKFLNPKLKSH